jgi:hypothetical protein
MSGAAGKKPVAALPCTLGVRMAPTAMKQSAAIKLGAGLRKIYSRCAL